MKGDTHSGDSVRGTWDQGGTLRRARGAVSQKETYFISILYPYTAERRDVLENTLPEAQEISQGRGFCTPRPERLPEGEARGQSRGPRGAKSPPEGNLEGRGGCIFQCIPTRGSVRTFFQN